MNYENTDLYFLKRDALRVFGDEEGKQIYDRASKLYTELAVTTDYQGSRTYEIQLKRLVYPVIAAWMPPWALCAARRRRPPKRAGRS